ncbi:hypothetical protein ANO14919_143280 [Xylariales sp. No.14919]|nr:hypothetical protein ANO14919_143280 [Xylariales sp. No.14919]
MGMAPWWMGETSYCYSRTILGILAACIMQMADWYGGGMEPSTSPTPELKQQPTPQPALE